MNCIISIVNSNISLLNKLNENVRINLDEMKMFLLGQPMNKIINVVINFKESENVDMDQQMQLSMIQALRG